MVVHLLDSQVHIHEWSFCERTSPLAVSTEWVGWLDTEPPKEAVDRSLVFFDRGEEVVLQAGPDGIRVLLVLGKPLEEPVAWYARIVMNIQELLRETFNEPQQRTFLKPEKRR